MATKSPSVAAAPAKERKVPAQTTVEPFVDRALEHHRGIATKMAMTRHILTEWAKTHPAPGDEQLAQR